MLPSTTDDVIFDSISPPDLLRYARTSKTAYYAVSSYKRRNFHLNTLLSRYFPPSEMLYFRYLQFRTGMLISGSTALQFFNRLHYKESDLDLYVEHRLCVPVAVWLQGVGYKFQPRPNQGAATFNDALRFARACGDHSSAFFNSGTAGYSGRGVCYVFDFVKKDEHSERKVQLITAHHSPMEVILGFHSTCVMNIITHDKAYSLYPKATFELRQSLICVPSDAPKRETARQKYKDRGWEMVPTPSSIGPTPSPVAFPSSQRYVGDSQCWVMPILPVLPLPSSASPSPSNLTLSHIEINTWSLKFSHSGQGIMMFMNLATSNLRHSYIVADGTLQRYLTPVLVCSGDGRLVDDDLGIVLSYARGTLE